MVLVFDNPDKLHLYVCMYIQCICIYVCMYVCKLSILNTYILHFIYRMGKRFNCVLDRCQAKLKQNRHLQIRSIQSQKKTAPNILEEISVVFWNLLFHMDEQVGCHVVTGDCIG